VDRDGTPTLHKMDIGKEGLAVSKYSTPGPKHMSKLYLDVKSSFPNPEIEAIELSHGEKHWGISC
jgi:hypothetical protein